MTVRRMDNVEIVGPHGWRWLLGVALASTAIACKHEPVACAEFARQEGSRPSLTTFDKPTVTLRWTQCSDTKTRTLSCTTGHLHKTSCTCELGDGDHRTERKVKTDEDVPPERAGATAFVNAWCEFGLK